jgi:hypothetical protein
VRRRPKGKRSKIAELTSELVRIVDGGSRDRPIVVDTASLVEPTAAGEPCLRCGETTRAMEHEVERYMGEPLRVVRIRCRGCGYERPVYVRIAPVAVN